MNQILKWLLNGSLGKEEFLGYNGIWDEFLEVCKHFLLTWEHVFWEVNQVAHYFIKSGRNASIGQTFQIETEKASLSYLRENRYATDTKRLHKVNAETSMALFFL